MFDCIHCSLLYPELKGNGCPICNDEFHIFKPAQMMDKSSSQIKIFRKLFTLFDLISNENSNFNLIQ